MGILQGFFEKLTLRVIYLLHCKSQRLVTFLLLQVHLLLKRIQKGKYFLLRLIKMHLFAKFYWDKKNDNTYYSWNPWREVYRQWINTLSRISNMQAHESNSLKEGMSLYPDSMQPALISKCFVLSDKAANTSLNVFALTHSWIIRLPAVETSSLIIIIIPMRRKQEYCYANVENLLWEGLNHPVCP